MQALDLCRWVHEKQTSEFIWPNEHTPTPSTKLVIQKLNCQNKLEQKQQQEQIDWLIEHFNEWKDKQQTCGLTSSWLKQVSSPFLKILKKYFLFQNTQQTVIYSFYKINYLEISKYKMIEAATQCSHS